MQGDVQQMGYELQTPMGLKNKAGNFEPIAYRKNPDVKDAQNKAARMFAIGFPTGRNDAPTAITIHRKQEPWKKRYIYNTINGKEEEEEIVQLEKKELPSRLEQHENQIEMLMQEI